MQIAPRNFSQVLSDGVNMLARVWKSLFVPAFGAAIPLGALTLLVFRITGADDFLTLLFNDPLALQALTPDEFAELSIPFISAALIALLLQLVASAFISLATHRIVGAELAGSPISGGAASGFALARVASLLLASAIAGIGMMLGLFLLVIPGIWLAVMLTMTPQVIALENASVIDSLRRSFALVRGRWWPTIGFLLIAGLVGTIAGQMVQLVMVPLIAIGGVSTSAGLAFVVGMLVQGLLISAIAVLTTLWYVDLRARKEPLLSESLS